MRKDVANLLERLGRRDFQYQEFADRFTEVELWPIFEALIRDPRILTLNPHDASDLPAARGEAATAASSHAATPSAPDAASAARIRGIAPGTNLATLFARYGGGTMDDAAPRDVGAMLKHLAQQIEQGKL